MPIIDHLPGNQTLRKAIRACEMKVEQMTKIGPCVIRGLERNSDRSVALLDRKLPKFLHGLGRDFAGVKGSRICNALVEGNPSYRSYRFVKTS
jgi:hypothetical protein